MSKNECMDEYKITELAQGLWAIDDEKGDSLYLIEGTKKALLIDTGMCEEGLTPILRTLTQKPIELAITHAHIDHMYHANEFDVVYMHKDEMKAWYGTVGLCMFLSAGMFQVKHKSYRIKRFTPIDEDTVLELGDIKIRVLHSPGHTPGSVTFVDEVHKTLFLGDVVGSGNGAWLWFPGCYSVKAYKEALSKFLIKLEPYKDYTFLGGHRMQGIPTENSKNVYPLTIQVVKDMEALCEKMLLGEISPQNQSRMGMLKLNTFTYGQATMLQRKQKVK